jgi:tetratricopeptide (TPR) repeat protein
MLFIILGLSSLTALLLAQGQPGAIKKELNFYELTQVGAGQLEEGRSTLDEERLMTARKTFEQCLLQNVSNSLCYYYLGRTDSYLFQAKELHKDKKAAGRVLDAAIENTRRSIALDEGRADAHALLADLYGRKIGYGGMTAGMRYGPKAETETRRALELDSKNALAYAVLGRRQLYSPKVFGGDVDKAIVSFRKATELDPRYDEGFVWLALAYEKKGDSVRAQAAAAEALRLNSRSALAKQVQSTGH